MPDIPQRTRTYHGPITDSTRWDGFDIRDDDVFICTPPKCGTTWSQGICMMMIFGKVDFEGSLTSLSPWLESSTREIEEVNAVLNNQTNRRCIKSHTPMDGITYNPTATYIAVYRHPLDVHFSMRKHSENMDNAKLDHLFPDDPRAGALKFIKDTPPEQDCDHLTLETLIAHYKSFKKWEGLPNVHLFHYAKMKADLAREMHRFADVLGYSFTPDKMAELVEGATFDAMRKKPEQFTPAAGMGFFKDDAKFFYSASSIKWAKHLNEDDLAQYSARMGALLTENERKWLETGFSA
jgi:aryl sulfotransferase